MRYGIPFELYEPGDSVDFTDKKIIGILLRAKDRFNNFYKYNKVPNPKEIKDMKIHKDYIEFTIECAKNLSAGREGNSLRQLSIILIDLGFDKYLSKTIPGKLFVSKIA
jgi:hypothetical protein